MSLTRMEGSSIHWFRKGLRLHDNPALLEACRSSSKVYPLFVLDSKFAVSDLMGVNRYNFLLESLSDLDRNLRQIGSRLYVVQGKAEEQIPILAEKWGITLLTFESDYGPYSLERDALVSTALVNSGIKVSKHETLTLFDPERYIAASKGNIPKSYQSFIKLFDSFGLVRTPVTTVTRDDISSHEDERLTDEYSVPSLSDMGYTPCPTTSFRGGESEALRRLQDYVVNKPNWVIKFEKPNTSPNSLEPSTTVLSPYLMLGCLSATTFYHALADIYKTSKSGYSQPPVSLHGQLLWREFFYLCSITTPNFNRMEGNPLCRQIPWSRDAEKIAAWRDARTGYPFIDALMTQLRVEGWIHHLGRHAVACFLTRGDLWQHWEAGLKVFECWLLDGDFALNCANWQWLSCSRFFYQYSRCYSPIAFGKKTDPSGDYIKKWLPVLAKFPAKYIYEPWTAPIEVQRGCGCIIGQDYPQPIVDHKIASKENMDRMAQAYAAHKDTDNGDDGGRPVSNAEKQSKTVSKRSAKDMSSPSSSLGPLDDFVSRKPRQK